MTKVTALKIINPLLGLLLLSQILTGLLSDHIPYEVFDAVHGGGGIALAVLATLHVILNWSWIKANFFRKAPTAKT